MQDVLEILDFQVQGYGSSAGCVQDPGFSGAWVGLFCRMCLVSWTFRCMGRAGLQDVFRILDFQVHG